MKAGSSRRTLGRHWSASEGHLAMTAEERSPAELERAAEEQAALRRIATLVATGATESELTAAVTSEIGRYFRAQTADTMRWDGDTIAAIGSWSADGGAVQRPGLAFPYGGDTITARIVETAAPARVNSPADLQTELARQLWIEFGVQSSVGAPITVDGKVWGVVTASRTQPDDPFPPRCRARAARLRSPRCTGVRQCRSSWGDGGPHRRAVGAVLETGLATRAEESSPERATCSVIGAPVIVKASLVGALTASRPGSDAFPAGAEIRLRSFADLAAQSIANERAQAELRASRARIVRAADETRRGLERTCTTARSSAWYRSRSRASARRRHVAVFPR